MTCHPITQHPPFISHHDALAFIMSHIPLPFHSTYFQFRRYNLSLHFILFRPVYGPKSYSAITHYTCIQVPTVNRYSLMKLLGSPTTSEFVHWWYAPLSDTLAVVAPTARYGLVRQADMPIWDRWLCRDAPTSPSWNSNHYHTAWDHRQYSTT